MALRRSLGGGLYMRPTVVTEVDHSMRLMKEETFGPILPVMRFRTTEEAIELANDTEFGLTASVLAGNEEEGIRIAEQVNAGSLFIQDTFLTFAKLRKSAPTASAFPVSAARAPDPSR